MSYLRYGIFMLAILSHVNAWGGGRDIKLDVYNNGSVKCINVQNSFYKIILVPDFGGRIFNWLDKLNNVAISECKIPKEMDEKVDPGGMLDDRGSLTNEKYGYVAEHPSEDTVKVRLWARDTKSNLEIVKTLLFKANSPVVNVTYKYSNYSQNALTGFAIGIRNFILPGGKETVTAEDRYFVPTTHGIRRISGYIWKDVSGQPMPELKTKLYENVSAPWHAFLNTNKQNGIAVCLEDNFYAGWYVWKPQVAKPTYEWAYKDLPAGHYRETSFNLVQADGLAGIIFASSELLADMRLTRKENELKIETVLKPLLEKIDLKLSTEITAIAGNWKKTLETEKISSQGTGKNYNTTVSVNLPGNGLYEVKQSLRSSGKVIAEWQEVLPVGEGITTIPLYTMAYRTVSQARPIPGWQGPEKRKLAASPEAEKRGFMLSLPGTGKAYSDLDKLSIDMACNEFESTEFLFLPLRHLGQIKVELKNAESVGAVVRIQKKMEIDCYSYGMGIAEAMILFPESSFDGTAPASIWLTAGNRKLKPGYYKLEISVSAVDGVKAIIPVEINVYNVSLPARPLISLEAEGYPMAFPTGKNEKLLDCWLDNMTEHGIDFFQEFNPGLGPKIYSSVKLLGTDIKLSDDLKKRQEFYKAGKNLPELDFSAFDYYVDRALNRGLVRFKVSRYDISIPDALEKHIFSQAAKYLFSKGYQRRDVFVKILDEQPVDKFPSMAATAEWLKECGFRPFSTFHLLLGKPQELKILSPYFEMFQGGFTTRSDYARRLDEGLLKPDDIILNYTGSGTCFQSYNKLASFGFNAAAMGHQMFHNHEYMRGGNQRLVTNIIFVGDDGKPKDSPAFEGLRDGMESGNLWALYAQWKTLLKDNKDMAAVLTELEAEFSRIIGNKSSLLKIQQEKVQGYDIESLEPASTENYYAAHQTLLKILDKMRYACEKYGQQYATVEWNKQTIWSNKQSFYCIEAKDKPEEKAVREYFIDFMSAHSGIPKSNLKSDKTGTKIIFELVSQSPLMPYTYQICENKGEIRILGTSEKNLMLGAENLIKTMNISGVWR